MKTISNSSLSITVNDHGAELTSLRHGGREYLWQADAAFWKRHSPVLFPIVGAVWQNEYRSHGQTFQLGQHGFARDVDFHLISQTETELRYVLESSAETLAKYPYPFRLEIGYQLNGNCVRVLWRVVNPGSEPLAFQIGAHPAFFWPMLSDACIDGGVEAMTQPLADTDLRGYFRLDADAQTLPVDVITQGGCVGAESSVQLDAEGYLPITVNTFDHDALIFSGSHVRGVTLCRHDRTPYLTLRFSSPLVGLWSPPHKRAPFVCIEPWYGRTDPAGYAGQFESKPHIQTLAPGAVFDASYDIIVEG